MTYYCEFPGCEYKTDNRRKIHKHHIRPKSLIKCEKEYNYVYLCPNCHNTKIFIPEADSGVHSFEDVDSVQIIRWISSSTGMLLEYIDYTGELNYTIRKNTTTYISKFLKNS